MAEQHTTSRYPVAECTSNRCQERIIWTITEAKGKRRAGRMPVDAKPDPAGLILLLPNPDDPATPIAHVESNAHKRFGKQCFTSHFATCPDADRFRR